MASVAYCKKKFNQKCVAIFLAFCFFVSFARAEDPKSDELYSDKAENLVESILGDYEKSIDDFNKNWRSGAYKDRDFEEIVSQYTEGIAALNPQDRWWVLGQLLKHKSIGSVERYRRTAQTSLTTFTHLTDELAFYGLGRSFNLDLAQFNPKLLGETKISLRNKILKNLEKNITTVSDLQKEKALLFLLPQDPQERIEYLDQNKKTLENIFDRFKKRDIKESYRKKMIAVEWELFDLRFEKAYEEVKNEKLKVDGSWTEIGALFGAFGGAGVSLELISYFVNRGDVGLVFTPLILGGVLGGVLGNRIDKSKLKNSYEKNLNNVIETYKNLKTAFVEVNHPNASPETKLKFAQFLFENNEKVKSRTLIATLPENTIKDYVRAVMNREGVEVVIQNTGFLSALVEQVKSTDDSSNLLEDIQKARAQKVSLSNSPETVPHTNTKASGFSGETIKNIAREVVGFVKFTWDQTVGQGTRLKIVPGYLQGQESAEKSPLGSKNLYHFVNKKEGGEIKKSEIHVSFLPGVNFNSDDFKTLSTVEKHNLMFLSMEKNEKKGTFIWKGPIGIWRTKRHEAMEERGLASQDVNDGKEKLTGYVLDFPIENLNMMSFCFDSWLHTSMATLKGEFKHQPEFNSFDLPHSKFYFFIHLIKDVPLYDEKKIVEYLEAFLSRSLQYKSKERISGDFLIVVSGDEKPVKSIQGLIQKNPNFEVISHSSEKSAFSELESYVKNKSTSLQEVSSDPSYEFEAQLPHFQAQDKINKIFDFVKTHHSSWINVLTGKVGKEAQSEFLKHLTELLTPKTLGDFEKIGGIYGQLSNQLIVENYNKFKVAYAPLNFDEINQRFTNQGLGKMLSLDRSSLPLDEKTAARNELFYLIYVNHIYPNPDKIPDARKKQMVEFILPEAKNELIDFLEKNANPFFDIIGSIKNKEVKTSFIQKWQSKTGDLSVILSDGFKSLKSNLEKPLNLTQIPSQDTKFIKNEVPPGTDIRSSGISMKGLKRALHELKSFVKFTWDQTVGKGDRLGVVPHSIGQQINTNKNKPIVVPNDVEGLIQTLKTNPILQGEHGFADFQEHALKNQLDVYLKVKLGNVKGEKIFKTLQQKNLLHPILNVVQYSALMNTLKGNLSAQELKSLNMLGHVFTRPSFTVWFNKATPVFLKHELKSLAEKSKFKGELESFFISRLGKERYENSENLKRFAKEPLDQTPYAYFYENLEGFPLPSQNELLRQIAPFSLREFMNEAPKKIVYDPDQGKNADKKNPFELRKRKQPEYTKPMPVPHVETQKPLADMESKMNALIKLLEGSKYKAWINQVTNSNGEESQKMFKLKLSLLLSTGSKEDIQKKYGDLLSAVMAGDENKFKSVIEPFIFPQTNTLSSGVSWEVMKDAYNRGLKSWHKMLVPAASPFGWVSHPQPYALEFVPITTQRPVLPLSESDMKQVPEVSIKHPFLKTLARTILIWNLLHFPLHTQAHALIADEKTLQQHLINTDKEAFMLKLDEAFEQSAKQGQELRFEDLSGVKKVKEDFVVTHAWLRRKLQAENKTTQHTKSLVHNPFFEKEKLKSFKVRRTRRGK